MLFNKSQQASEEEVIKGCLNGERSYQKKLYERFSSKMLGVCLRYASDRSEAEDMLQEGFVKVFESIGNYRFNGSFEGWVRRVFIYTSINLYRKRVRYFKESDSLDHVNPADDETILDQINTKEIIKMIQKLPEGYRLIFNLYAIEGFTHNEISEQLGIAVGTSKSQYARARMYLQRLLKENENIDYERYSRTGQL